MKQYRVNLTETLVYKEVIVEANSLYEAEQKQIELLDRNEIEIIERSNTDYRVDEI